MARIIVQQQDFNLNAECAALTLGRENVGAVGCFVGIVRESGSRKLEALVLEHYPSMTERAIGRIVAEAERRWNLLGCTVIHRVGQLRLGENIVLVLAAAAHRQAALEATQFLIDWLKTKAPFWKKELFADGGDAWVEVREADDQSAARWMSG